MYTYWIAGIAAIFAIPLLTLSGAVWIVVNGANLRRDTVLNLTMLGIILNLFLVLYILYTQKETITFVVNAPSYVIIGGFIVIGILYLVIIKSAGYIYKHIKGDNHV